MGAINSLASVFTLNSSMKIAMCALCPFTDDGSDTPDIDKFRAFQYFPETITDAKSSNYAEKQIPGGSHPLYQWISGGGRTISFSVVFSDEENDENDAGLSFGAKEIAGLAAGLIGALLGGKKPKHVQNIATAITWLRGFMYPKYASGSAGGIGRVQAPPKIALYMPGSGIVGGVKGFQVPDSLSVIMTQCDVTYEGFFRNGKGRFIVVQLAFNEIIQVGDEWGFIGREAMWGSGDETFESYNRDPQDGRIPDTNPFGDGGGGGGVSISGGDASVGNIV